MKGSACGPFFCLALSLEESDRWFDKTRERFGRRRRVEDPRIALKRFEPIPQGVPNHQGSTPWALFDLGIPDRDLSAPASKHVHDSRDQDPDQHDRGRNDANRESG